MSIKVSTGLANEITDRAALRTNLQNGRLLIFSGTQPTNADTASNGTLLCTITNSSGAFVGETLAVWTVVLSGSAGTVDSIKVGGIELMSGSVSFTTDLTTTAAAVASNINNFFSMLDFTATSSGANVYVTAPKGSGATLNSMVCTASATTMTATPSSAGAVTTAGVTTVNGLQWAFPAASGKVAMSGTWSGLGVAAGTAGWFRYCCDSADAGTAASTSYRRLDGTVTITGGGGDITIDNTNVSINQIVTCSNTYLSTVQG